MLAIGFQGHEYKLQKEMGLVVIGQDSIQF